MTDRFASLTREELVERIETLEKANSEQGTANARLLSWYSIQKWRWGQLEAFIVDEWNGLEKEMEYEPLALSDRGRMAMLEEVFIRMYKLERAFPPNDTHND